MTDSEFLLQWNGKENDNGSFKGQCVNLIHSYYEEVLKLNRFVGNAIDYLNETRLPLFKDRDIQPGDIVIFNYGKVGHIGVCVWSRNQDFECLEQNNPLGSPCHYVYHTDFQNIVGHLRPDLHEAPRPHPVTTMNYTCFNLDLVPMEQANKLLSDYSGGKITCQFNYKFIPTLPGIFGTDQQVQFLKNHPITTRFIFYGYNGGISGSQMATAEVPGTDKILTAATPPNQDPVYICYEFVNALYAYLGKVGDDIYTPTEDFIKAKLAKILPLLKGGVIT